MMNELLNEQKEDLFNFAQRGCTDSDIRDYCVENKIPYTLARKFMDEVYEYLDKQ